MMELSLQIQYYSFASSYFNSGSTFFFCFSTCPLRSFILAAFRSTNILFWRHRTNFRLFLPRSVTALKYIALHSFDTSKWRIKWYSQSGSLGALLRDISTRLVSSRVRTLKIDAVRFVCLRPTTLRVYTYSVLTYAYSSNCNRFESTDAISCLLRGIKFLFLFILFSSI